MNKKNRKSTSINIDPKLWKTVKLIATMNEKRVSDFLEELIRKEVDCYKRVNLIQ